MITSFPRASRFFGPLAVLSFVSFGACAVGCSSTTSTTGSSGGPGATTTGTPISSSDCSSRCAAKVETCGSTATDAPGQCAQLVCSESVTDDRMKCFEDKTCDELGAATSFADICPASSTTTPPATGGATCGSKTCQTGEYCSLTYDSSTQTWSPGSCAKIPSACTDKGGADVCSCMQDNAGCPTSGVVSTKCSQSNGALSFGCE